MQHQKATKHTDSLRKSKPAGVLSALSKPAIGEQKQAVQDFMYVLDRHRIECEESGKSALPGRGDMFVVFLGSWSDVQDVFRVFIVRFSRV